jgi:phospholipase C
MNRMDTRREFFKKAAMMAGGSGLVGALLSSIEKAAAIPPADESTFLDAEHVVILMQENRSFDHCFGTLRGVRGFDDPRAVTLPNQNPVWLQTNSAGDTYAPFRLDAQRSNATWLGSLPHTWPDQNDAKNNGDHDKWLIAKPVNHHDPEGMPLTMGYYNREDLPFYYALADAFTICDQHFCSCLTGTAPNRLYLWSATIRQQQNADSPAKVRNEDVDYDAPACWTTFPERLEEAGVSWRIYQNEISLPSGLTDEENSWLGNFSDNPIEWFPQFDVGLANKLREGESLSEFPERTRSLHTKAFTTNSGDPDYRKLTALRYEERGSPREVQIPKGDVLYQFRKDVTDGKLPAISWIVAPEQFSDHPSAPWYGAWYVAEVMNILTQNQEVWRKTVFILTYDENDGFFDHVPPFAAPRPGHPETGAVSNGIDTAVEYVTLEQDLAHHSAAKARGGSIGLGFRVPLLVASPWSRGGAVCSQVFDHTSVLQFLEAFASHKCGKQIQEANITAWRRTVCGDLSSVFQSTGRSSGTLPYPAKNAFIERIYNAQFKSLPVYRALSRPEIEDYKRDPQSVSSMPQQEPGIRPARALPYELCAEGRLSTDRRSLELTLNARKDRFGERAAGSPFHVYAPGRYLHKGVLNRTRSYAVEPGQSLQDSWQLAGFGKRRYHLRVCGPNGFLVEMTGDRHDPLLEIAASCPPEASVAQLRVSFTNKGKKGSYRASILHHAYGFPNQTNLIPPGGVSEVTVDLVPSHGWYDFSVRIDGRKHFERRYAGHVETGQPSFSDPQIGQRT